jgi:hypothetical protein
VFLPGPDAATVLSVCTRLGLDPSGRSYGVAGGILLKLARPIAEPEPGATRLRELNTDLFVAADAELIPSLLNDEASGIVRDGGLVFLPGGVVLRFDRTAPLGLAALLDAAPRPRREWRPMPEPLALAERVIEVSREWPEPRAEDLYRAWEQDVRRPDSSRRGSWPGGGRGPAGAGDGGADEGAAELVDAGSGSAGGLMSNLRNLGEAVRNLAGRAGSRARSVGEKLRWGMLDHSALVQKLLRELRQGDANQALRHAFSMAPADPRDRWVGWGNHLPFSRAIYNLFDLLGTSSRGGTVGIWQARPDLMEELRREYRKVAERAIRQGDFRRAAYVYGKLLGDDRLAAQALQRGGLHHDAAILYLKKLNDRAAAAQAFEAAGLVDRAITLYRELGRHEAAGDLLRRIGDDAGATTEYMTAVRIASHATPPDFFEAGRILHHKACLADLAVEAFRCGWGQRPAANATASVLELIAIHAPRGEISPLRELLDDADAFFKSVSSVPDAEAFYNRMATSVANMPALSTFAEEVHDRARSALANQLRRQVESGRSPASAVSTLFGVPSLWAPSFVRDAQFAAAVAADRSRDRDVKADRHTKAPGIQVGRGTVTAACQASSSAELFLGFANGQILAYRPGQNRVVPIGAIPSPIRAVATDIDGQVVVGLYTDEHRVVLAAFLRQPDGTFLRRPDFHFPASPQTFLTPVFTVGTSRLIGLAHGSELVVLEAASGLTHAHVSLRSAGHLATTALLLPHGEALRILTHSGPQWTLYDDQGQPVGRPILGWRPVGGGVTSRCSVPLSGTCLDGLVKLVGLDAHGAVHASQFWIEEGVLELLSSPVATTDGGYLAAAQTGPNRVVAVAAGRIDWLSDGSDRFQTVNSLTDQGLDKTVACFPSTSPEEVLVVATEGFISRIAVPRRGRRHQRSG